MSASTNSYFLDRVLRVGHANLEEPTHGVKFACRTLPDIMGSSATVSSSASALPLSTVAGLPFSAAHAWRGNNAHAASQGILSVARAHRSTVGIPRLSSQSNDIGA